MEAVHDAALLEDSSTDEWEDVSEDRVFEKVDRPQSSRGTSVEVEPIKDKEDGGIDDGPHLDKEPG